MSKRAISAIAIGVVLSAGMVSTAGPAVADTAQPTPAGQVGAAPGTGLGTGPVVGSVGGVDIDGVGTEVRVAVASATPVAGLTATLTLGGSTSTTSAFSLVSGTATDGVWQTTGPLGLAYGTWTASVVATDTGGGQSAAVTGAVDYTRRAPVITGTFDTDHLDYETQSATLTGKVWAYDPATGLNDPAWANASVELWGFPGSMTEARPAADGTFSVTGHVDAGELSSPVMTSVDLFTVVIPQDGSGLAEASGPKATVSFAQNPVRAVFDGPVTYKDGQKLTLSGTEQYYSFASKTWKPLANAQVAINDTSPEQAAATDAAGHFSYSTTNGPSTSTSWTVHLPYFHSAYLQDAATSVHVSVIAKSSPSILTSWLDAESRLHIEGDLIAVDQGPLGNRRLYVQQSQDGRTWTTLGYLTTDASGNYNLDGHVAVPHGQWRLYYPGDAGDQPGYSNIVSFSRDETVVNGGRPSSTSVARGHAVSFSGSITAKGTGAWGPVANQRAYLLFRPTGSGSWQMVSSKVTDRNGHYALSARANRGGTWTVVYLADGAHVDADGPQTYVRTH